MNLIRCPDNFTRKRAEFVNVLFDLACVTPSVVKAKIAAGVIYKNKMVGIGTNLRKSSPFQKKFGRNTDSIYIHAEIAAIRNALYHISVDDMSRAELIVIRAKWSGVDRHHRVPGLAKPCEDGCQRCIAAFGLKRTYFSTDEGTLECL